MSFVVIFTCMFIMHFDYIHPITLTPPHLSPSSVQLVTFELSCPCPPAPVSCFKCCSQEHGLSACFQWYRHLPGEYTTEKNISVLATINCGSPGGGGTLQTLFSHDRLSHVQVLGDSSRLLWAQEWCNHATAWNTVFHSSTSSFGLYHSETSF